MAQVSVSILSADFGNLKTEIERINKADHIHFDVMDGIFVPNLTFGNVIGKAIKKITEIPLDIHLMIVNPKNNIDSFIELKPKIISFHYEAYRDLHINNSKIIELIKYIKEKDSRIKVGVAINPETNLLDNEIEILINNVDLILIMSVHPGFAGQKFIDITEKIKKLKEKIKEMKRNVLIEVDGGIKLENANKIVKAGADILAIGSGIFKEKNPNEIISKIKKI